MKNFQDFLKEQNSDNTTVNEKIELEEKGLWDNIHAKRKRIKAGSGERMRKPGSKGAPTAQNLKSANEEAGYDEFTEMTRSELKIAINSAKEILALMDEGVEVERWQISEIVKASDSLATVYQNLCADNMDESVDAGQIDELSNEKKMAYGKAAFADYHKQSKAKLGKILSGDKDTSGESRKITNRLKGINNSSKTEDVQVEEKDPRLERAGVSGFNKAKATPSHPTKSHIVVAKSGDQVKTIRFGQQGAETAGDPKSGESDRMKAKRASFKARHGKNIAKGKMSAAYWADKAKW